MYPERSYRCFDVFENIFWKYLKDELFKCLQKQSDISGQVPRISQTQVFCNTYHSANYCLGLPVLIAQHKENTEKGTDSHRISLERKINDFYIHLDESVNVFMKRSFP